MDRPQELRERREFRELVAAVQARLFRVNETGSLACVMEPEAFELGSRLTDAFNELLSAGGDELAARHALGWLYWWQSTGLPEPHRQAARDGAITLLKPCFMTRAGVLPEPLIPDLAARAIPDATALLQRAVALPRIPPSGASNTSTAFEQRLLDATVTAWTQIAGAFEGQPAQAAFLSNLCGALRARYEHQARGRDLRDLDEAIAAARRAVTATAEPGPDRDRYLTNLAAVLHLRFDRTGSTADLNQAISASRACTSPDHKHRPYMLARYGELLRLRAERTRRATDLDAAITVAREAVARTPESDPAGRAARQVNLAAALLQRVHSLADGAAVMADLAESITACRQAAATRWAPVKVKALSNLGAALQERFERAGERADLDAAVTVAREAVTITAQPGDAGLERAVALTNLGRALARRFEHDGHRQDLDDAVRVTTEAAHTAAAPAAIRVRAACIGGRLAAPVDAARGAALLEAAVAMLPLLAPRHLTGGDARHMLGEIAGVANDAAAAVLANATAGPPSARAAKALGLLEQGRGVLLGRGFDVRGDQAALESEHPAVAARLAELRNLLDGRPAPLVEPDSDPDRPAPVEPDRMSLAADLENLLTHIRRLDGFASFALPPAEAELIAAGAEGPIVVFNVTLTSGHALLLTAGGVKALPLPGLTVESVLAQGRILYPALDEALLNAPSSPSANARMHDVLEWLWDNATGPVLEALGIHSMPASGRPAPRIWWATGGVLGMLPVHAAGHHADPRTPTRRTVVDRVASSYTPTIRALLHARKHRDRSRDRRLDHTDAALSSLIVAMPATPEASALPGAADEARMVASVLPDPLVLIEPEPGGGRGERPTKHLVLRELPRRSIAHFACHGDHDAADPAASRLLLHDHQADPLSVGAMAAADLSHVRLAFLSACNTASGLAPGRLIDEAIHLAAAFQLAGFPHVVGTQWVVGDAVAANVAHDFYAELIDAATGELDVERCAHALRTAILRQRNRHLARPYLWAAHIHAGT